MHHCFHLLSNVTVGSPSTETPAYNLVIVITIVCCYILLLVNVQCETIKAAVAHHRIIVDFLYYLGTSIATMCRWWRIPCGLLCVAQEFIIF